MVVWGSENKEGACVGTKIEVLSKIESRSRAWISIQKYRENNSWYLSIPIIFVGLTGPFDLSKDIEFWTIQTLQKAEL